MALRHAYQVPEPLQGSETNLTVLFCIPDTPTWRRLITAMVSGLAYARSYDEQTGIVADAASVGLEIFNTMQMCDLETQLARIADALDGGNQRYSIDDIVQALQEIDTGLDVADFLEMLSWISVLISKLPGLNFTISIPELIEMAFSARYRASHLNYLEDMALSQRGTMISTGGLPIQGIYENIGDGFNALAAGVTGGASPGMQWLYQVIKGKDIQIGQDLIDLLNGLLFGSIRDANYDIESQIQALKDKLDEMVQQVGNHPAP